MIKHSLRFLGEGPPAGAPLSQEKMLERAREEPDTTTHKEGESMAQEVIVYSNVG